MEPKNGLKISYTPSSLWFFYRVLIGTVPKLKKVCEGEKSFLGEKIIQLPPACTVSRVVVEVVEDEASEAIEAKETERSGGKPPSVSIWRLVKDFLRAGIKKKKEVREGGSRKITKIFATFFFN